MSLSRFLLAAAVLYLFIVKLCAQQQAALRVSKKTSSTSARRLFPDSSFAVLKNSLAQAMEKNNKLAAAICLKQMGHICYQLEHYPQALDYHLQADKLFRERNESILRAENLDDIGLIFLQNHQPLLARQQYDEAFAIYRDYHNTPGIAHTYGKIGHLYAKQHHYDSALHYERLALNRYIYLKDEDGIAKTYGELGNIYEDLGKYDSGYYYFKHAIQLSRQTRDTTSIIEGLNNMGDILRKTGHYKEALLFTYQSLVLALHTNEQFHLGSAYRDLASTHHLMGNNDSAYYFQSIGQHHLEDVYARQTGTQLAMLKTIYDVEKKNSVIGQLKADRRTTVAIIIIIILMLVIGTLIISRQRLRIRNGQLLNEQQKQAHEVQQSIMKLQEQNLKQELDTRSKELSTYTLHIMQKNQLLENLQKQLDEMLKDERRDQKKQIKQLQLQINQHFNQDEHWDEFHTIFDQLHQSFFQKLKERCDTLTRSDLRLVALLKMNLSSVDIATMLAISQDSVRVMRYRIRKKLNLKQGESLTMFVQSL